MSKDALRASSRRGTFSDADLTSYAEAWQQPGAMRTMIHWYRALFRHPPTMPDDVRVHVPTRILWGARDRFLGRELAGMSAAYCDDADVVMYEQASHWLQHEEAESVNQQLAAFFKDHPTG
jgi:pimeloyl-ACP methyl ester carboxylesterase